MSRILPHPLASAALVLMWLILTRFSLGHLILGSVIAVIAGRALAALQPAGLHLKRWDLIPRLLAVVAWDIMRSNATVARLILTGGRDGQRQSSFVEVRLALRDRNALAFLAIILTATPGTAWLDYHPARGVLLLHVFDNEDGTDWPDFIRARYERVLMEIFE